MACVQSAPAPCASGEIIPTSNAAWRRVVAEVRMSAGRSIRCDGIRPTGSTSALGSTVDTMVWIASRSSLWPVVLGPRAQRSAWLPQGPNTPWQSAQRVGSSGPAAVLKDAVHFCCFETCFKTFRMIRNDLKHVFKHFKCVERNYKTCQNDLNNVLKHFASKIMPGHLHELIV